MSQNNVRFPGTNERVISIRGNHDAIKLCVNMIQEKIRNDEPPGNGGGDTPLRPGSSSKTRFDTGACRGVQGRTGAYSDKSLKMT